MQANVKLYVCVPVVYVNVQEESTRVIISCPSLFLMIPQAQENIASLQTPCLLTREGKGACEDGGGVRKGVVIWSGWSGGLVGWWVVSGSTGREREREILLEESPYRPPVT